MTRHLKLALGIVLLVSIALILDPVEAKKIKKNNEKKEKNRPESYKSHEQSKYKVSKKNKHEGMSQKHANNNKYYNKEENSAKKSGPGKEKPLKTDDKNIIRKRSDKEVIIEKQDSYINKQQEHIPESKKIETKQERSTTKKAKRSVEEKPAPLDDITIQEEPEQSSCGDGIESSEKYIPVKSESCNFQTKDEEIIEENVTEENDEIIN